MSEHRPHIPASQSLPEITVKGVVLGLLLSMVLAGANAYLGLFAAITVSASIPAAVVSMAVLSFFRRSNILENNIVQTAASAGEGLAAGVIFTLPALVIMQTWAGFNYWETTFIAALGGTLGVLFTIPLRRALIVEQPLRFPEGVATAEVLKAGDQGGSGLRLIAQAGLLGALFKFAETGLRLWNGILSGAVYLGSGVVFFGINLSPALVAVGFIVGLNIAVLMFLGGVVNWLVAIPVIAVLGGAPEGLTASAAAQQIWSTQTRFMGVGAMVVGGLWALISLRKSLVSGIRSGLAAYRQMRSGEGDGTPRTDLDTPMQWVGVAVVVAAVPLFFLFSRFTDSWSVGAFMAVIMLAAGFLFAAVGGYMTGLVGSSNNPISGVSIATILAASLLLLALLGTGSAVGPAAAIFIGSVVAAGVGIAGDNMQDLKAGYLLGATPFKQQIMQVIGVIAASLVMSPVLNLLNNAYGIGVPTQAHPNPLAAPQATLMAAVASGVFHGGLPWNMVIFGMLVAVVVIVLDLYLKSRGSTFRTPVLAVALGLYLPLALTSAIFAGGLLAWAVSRGRQQSLQGDGLLFSAGLITGEALVGILLAIPIVLVGSSDALAVFGDYSFMAWPGLIVLVLIILRLYRVALPSASRGR
ncbi:MAG TPA: oligopeptide transporter, OPT family [Acidobacteriota bacterium]|nr:oligopeptide transporter, OPT family [Acidobacteriota bacterium]